MKEEIVINDKVDSNIRSKRSKSVKILVACVVGLALIVVTAMLTFSLTINYYYSYPNSELSRKIDIVKRYIDEYAYYDADYDAMDDAALKAYVASAGDKYTTYYNAEDFKALNDDNEGRYVGIGVTVSVRNVEYSGSMLSLLEVVKVYKYSPADEVGIVSGDLIYSVISADGEIFADEAGLDITSSAIKGEEGTNVTLSILRKEDDLYRKFEVVVERRNVEVESVEYSVYQDDSNVGIVTISQFDLKTPKLLLQAISELRQMKIEKIVIDLRDNGGGDLNSVIACACYFVNEGDIIITAEDNKGNVAEHIAEKKTYSGSYASCNVEKKNIGIFKDMKFVILVNENTASAAELLTAVFRDYDIAPIVGVNTFGKGTMQTIYSLESFGIEGGIKITTDVYFPPCGENYNGIGISPDITVKRENGDFDNQLQTAVDQFK